MIIAFARADGYLTAENVIAPILVCGKKLAHRQYRRVTHAGILILALLAAEIPE
jgi:hypothetical protein